MRFPSRRGRRGFARGSAVTEFALVGSLLISLMFAVLDFGLAMNAQLIVSAAAREGARRAAVDGGDSGAVRERVRQHLSMGRIDPERATVVVSPRSASYGSTIRVQIDYPYRFITPAGRALAGGDSEFAGVR